MKQEEAILDVLKQHRKEILVLISKVNQLDYKVNEVLLKEGENKQ